MELHFGDIVLRDFTVDDIPYKVKWINDPENHRYLHYNVPLNVNDTTRWFFSKNNDIRKDFTVVYGGKPVGVIGLLAIDHINSKAEYYITIGEREIKHRGVATQASQALLNYAFKTLSLNKVYLTVDADNVHAVHLYQKLGFVQEGLFKQDLYRQAEDRYIDRIRFAAFSEKR